MNTAQRVSAAVLALLVIGCLPVSQVEGSAERTPVWAPGEPSAEAQPEPVRCRVVDYGDDLARYDCAGPGGTRYRSGSSAPLPLEFEHGPDVDGDGETEDDHVAFLRFSTIQSLSPPPWPASGYFPGVRNGTFYGGITWYEANTPMRKHDVTAEHYVNPNHEGPFFDRRAEDFALSGQTYLKNPDAAHRQFAVFLWRKEDFANRGDTCRVTFDGQSRMVMYIARYWHGFDDGRFVVRDGRRFYISEKTFDIPDWVKGTRWHYGKPYVCQPTETRWAEYDPEGYRIDFDPERADFREHRFEDVTAVGWYLGKRDLDTEHTHVKLYAFEVDAVVHRPSRPSENAAMRRVPAGGEIPEFYLSTCEVPYRLWKRVYRYATSPFYAGEPNYLFMKNGDMGSTDAGGFEHGQDEPVTDITYLDALAFCNALSEMEGRTPVYYTDPQRQNIFRRQEIATVATWPGGRAAEKNPIYRPIELPRVYAKWQADGYRLPTGAEWARAFREGGAGAPGWTGENSGGRTHPVGSAGAEGFHDMIGNVWELTWGEGGSYDAGQGAPYTALGGGIHHPAEPSEHPASPYGDRPFDGSHLIGLRLVRRAAGLPAPPGKYSEDVPVWRLQKGRKTDAPDPDARPDAPELVEVPEATYTREIDRADVFVSTFFMGKTEVTYAQWLEVYRWAVAHGYEFARDGDLGSMYWFNHSHAPDEPVTNITWHDMMVWCNALSELEGRTPAYYTDPEKSEVYRSAFAFRPPKVHARTLGRSRLERDRYSQWLRVNDPEPWVFVRWDADGYRLPTLAEWQRAARAQSESESPWTAEGGAEEFAWNIKNSGGRTHPVAGKKPNPLGLYDILGNVYERTWSIGDDAKDFYYDLRNPKGDWYRYDIIGQKVARRRHVVTKRPPYAAGGSWFWGGMNADHFIPSVGYPDVGFRVVRCEAGTHPRDGREKQERIVLDVDPQDLDLLQGQVWRGNVGRNGVFQASGLSRLSGLRWEFKTEGKVLSSPVAVDGRVFVGSSDGHFYAVDAETGELVWKVPVRGGVESSACVADGVVYFNGNDQRLYAADAETGEVIWRFAAARAGVFSPSSPVVGYGTVFCNMGRRGVVGVDVETGKEVWRCREVVAPKGLGSPTLAPGLHLQAGSGVADIYAASIRTERNIWQVRTLGYSSFNTAAVADGTVYAGTSAVEPGIAAVDLDTGKTLWSVFVEPHLSKEDRRGVLSSPTVGGGRLYIGSDSGWLYALDATSGERVWRFQTGGAVRSSPGLAGELLYFGSNDGNVYAVEADGGEERWRFETGGPVSSSPWLGDGVLYVGSQDGSLYALE